MADKLTNGAEEEPRQEQAQEERQARLAQLHRQVKVVLRRERRTASWLVALLGSIAMYPMLRYPLVQGWMARYVPDAPAASTDWVIVSVVVGTVLLIISAVLTARWSGAKNRAGAAGAGGIAGLLSGGLTFALFGAPAAGVAGSQAAYPFLAEPLPTPDLAALIDAILECAVWIYGMGWAMWLGGGIIGALVGAVAGAGSSVESDLAGSAFAERLMILIISLICCLGLVANVAVHDMLAQSIADSAVEVGYTPAIPPHFTRCTVIGSHMVVLLATLLLIWGQGRRRRPCSSAQSWYESRVFYVLGVVATLTVVLLLVVNLRAFLSVLGVGLVAILVLGVLLIILGRQYSLASRQTAYGPMALPGVSLLIVLGLVGGTIVVSLLQFLGAAFPLSLVLIVIPVLPYMSATSLVPPATTALELAETNYVTQIVWVIRAWRVASVAFVLVMLLLCGLIWLRERRRARTLGPDGRPE